MFTLVTTVIAVTTALLAFILDIAELRGDERKFLGLRLKTLKKVSTYVTLVMTVLTLWLTMKQDEEKQILARAKEHREDSLQTARFDSTLRKINTTLTKQDSTLSKQNITLQKQDSTLMSLDRILNGQKRELGNQVEMLGKQKLAMEKYTDILKRQVELGDSLSSSIDLMQKNLSTQKQSLGVLNNTTTSLQTLNFPLSAMSAIVKLRIYVKGFSSIINNNEKTPHRILSVNQNISGFVKEFIGVKLKSDSLVKYWQFFSFTHHSWSEHGFSLEYSNNGTKGQVVFNNYKSVGGSGMYVSYSDVIYSPNENYIECDLELFCGAVFLNSRGVKNLYEVLDSSKIQILVRYPQSKRVSLPICKNQTKWIEIDHIEIPEIKALKYGIGFQYVRQPIFRKLEADEKINIYNSVWNENYSKKDEWSFAGIELKFY